MHIYDKSGMMARVDVKQPHIFSSAVFMYVVPSFLQQPDSTLALLYCCPSPTRALAVTDTRCLWRPNGAFYLPGVGPRGVHGVDGGERGARGAQDAGGHQAVRVRHGHHPRRLLR